MIELASMIPMMARASLVEMDSGLDTIPSGTIPTGMAANWPASHGKPHIYDLAAIELE